MTLLKLNSRTGVDYVPKVGAVQVGGPDLGFLCALVRHDPCIDEIPLAFLGEGHLPQGRADIPKSGEKYLEGCEALLAVDDQVSGAGITVHPFLVKYHCAE